VKQLKYILLIATAITLSPLSLYAQTAEEKGLEIANEIDRRDEGFKDSTARLTMTLKNKAGRESFRYIRFKTLEVKGDGDKSLSIFDKPRDIKGTAMLTFSHPVDPDDQWMYLPALKRVKRISSRNKSGPFMGSEFAFEDLGSQEVAKYSYKWLHDEEYNSLDCFVLERRPAYEHSGYTRQEVWIDKAEYRIQKVKYYDRKNSLLKTQTFTDYNQYLNQYWRPGKMDMVNHQTGKSTRLAWDDYKFRVGLKDSSFNRNSLKRAR
jgi:outer membrane lipoprotein-sorting protein